jgi:hypothetical protein
MGDDTMDLAADSSVEALLKRELARENRAVSAVVPVLRHLLATEAQVMLSDVVLARVRGMIGDCAAQLLAASEGRDPAQRMAQGGGDDALDRWAEALIADAPLLGFCHALAIEALLAERFQQRHAIDPVLSPLLQELVASSDPAVAALAMSTLAAQSRFLQTQRRMELALGELPAELFFAGLAIGQKLAPGASERERIAQLAHTYDEAASRLGLLARLVAAMRKGAVAALALDHGGLGLCATALAARHRQAHGDWVLACHEGQGVRLALALRAADVPLAVIERQFALVEPAARLPRAIAELSGARAMALLAAGGAA